MKYLSRDTCILLFLMTTLFEHFGFFIEEAFKQCGSFGNGGIPVVHHCVSCNVLGLMCPICWCHNSISWTGFVYGQFHLFFLVGTSGVAFSSIDSLFEWIITWISSCCSSSTFWLLLLLFIASGCMILIALLSNWIRTSVVDSSSSCCWLHYYYYYYYYFKSIASSSVYY